MADQRTFLFAKLQGDHTYEKASKTQYIGNPIENKTKPAIKTFVLPNHQGINNYRTPVQNQPLINRVQDNTKSNTSVPKSFVFAKHLNINAYKIPVQNQSTSNKVQNNTKSNTSVPKTFVLAKHQISNVFKIPMQNQSAINKVQDNTKSNTFVFAKHLDGNAYKIPVQNHCIVNKVQDNTKSYTSGPKAFLLAKEQGKNTFKIPLENQSIINKIQDTMKSNTPEQKTYIFAKAQDINAYKIPVQTQSVINKVQNITKSSTSEPKTIMFAKRQDINAFKVPVQNQSVINKVQDHNAYKIPSQNKFVYAKFENNSTFKIPVQNKTLMKLVEGTTISNPHGLEQNSFTKDGTIKIAVPNKSANNQTIVNSAGKIPNQQVLISKNFILTPPTAASKNEKSYTIQKKIFISPDKVGKANFSNITFSPSEITSKYKNTSSIAIIPGGTIIKPTTSISNSISTVNIANINLNKQLLNLKQEFIPPIKINSNLCIPHNGISYMIKPTIKEDADIQTPKFNSLSSTVLVSPSVLIPQSVEPLKNIIRIKPTIKKDPDTQSPKLNSLSSTVLVSPSILIPQSVEPLKNIIISSSEVSKAFNTPNSVTQFVKNMENLPDGEYCMLPAKGNVPLCVENLFKLAAAQSVKHCTVVDRPNIGPVGNNFVSLEEKSLPPANYKQLLDETGLFKKPYPVLPRKSQLTKPKAYGKSFGFDNIGTIKKTIPLSLFNKSPVRKYKKFDGAVQGETNGNQEKISNPKMCTPSEFIKLTPNPETLNQLKKQQINSAKSDSQDKPTVKFSLNEQGNPQVLIKVLKTEQDSTITTDASTDVKREFLPEIANLPKVANANTKGNKVFSNQNNLSLSQIPIKSILKKISKYDGYNFSPRFTCEYEYCDTILKGIELIDNMYCSETCKKFNTKLMLAQERKPVVQFKMDTEIPKKLVIIDRKMMLLKLRNRINKRKQSKLSAQPKQISKIDFIEHEKKSSTIQAICERLILKRIPIRKPIIKSMKGSLSDDDEILHLRPKINHQISINYIATLQFKPTPKKLFVNPIPTKPNLFRVGQKLEGIDPGHESLFCVMTVMEVFGYRIKLHFDGYPNIYDFWVSADYPDIFYAKWCEQNSRIVEPPKNYKDFDWTNYLRLKLAFPAPKWNFSSTKRLATCQTHKFVIGNKLEALDKFTRTSPKQLICVATVNDILGDRILIHFDGWSIDFDYWVDIGSSNIHPIGWCSKNGRVLSRPNGYNDLRGKTPFTWASYLEETNSKPVPEEAFVRTPLREFTVNMAIEIFDIVVPSLLRIAKVVDVKGNEIKICYDGFSPLYEYWVEDDSPNIHPIGWSLKANHALEIPADPTKRESCGVTGCNGKGNINFTKSTHDDVKSCPYYLDHWYNAISGFSLIPERVKRSDTLKPEPCTKIPKKLPKKLPSKVPVELPIKRPIELPLKRPNELPTKRPNELPTKRPNDLPIELSNELPMKRPNILPLKRPNKHSIKRPNILPLKRPNELPTKRPNELPTKRPNDLPIELSNELPMKRPNILPLKRPNELPTKRPNELPTKRPNDLPIELSNELPMKRPNILPLKRPNKHSIKRPNILTLKRPNKLSKKLPTEHPEELPKKLPKELTKELPNKLPKELTKELPNKLTKELPNKLPKELTEELPKELTKELTKELPNKLHKELTKELPNKLPKELTKELPNKLTKELPNKLPKELTKELPNKLPKELTKELPKELTKELPNKLHKELTKELPNKLTKELPNKLPKELTKELPNKLPKELPNKLPKELPKKTECKSKKQEMLRKKIKANKIMYEERKRNHLKCVAVHEMFGIKHNKPKDCFSESIVSRIASIMEDMEPHNDDGYPSNLKTKRIAILGIPEVNASDVKKWSISQVGAFVDQVVIKNSNNRNLEELENLKNLVSGAFIDKEIDGEKLLTITKSDLIAILHLPLGPAVKIYSAIKILKSRHPQINFFEELDSP